MNETSGAEEAREMTVAEVAARDLPGKHLRATREKLGLSINDVAQSIKFSPRQIEALERDDHTVLPPGPTFIRGFIRSYAKLLRIESEPLLDLLPREIPVEAPELDRPEGIGARLPAPGQPRGWTAIAAVGALGLAVVALAVHYFYRGEPKPSATRQNPVAAAEPTPVAANEPAAANVTPATPTLPAPTPMASAAPSVMAPTPPTPAPVRAPIAPAAASAVPAAAAPDATRGVKAASASESAMPPSGHRHQLIFTFDANAWVEVKDASRAIIFSQNNAAGTRQIVSGTPPFDLVIGNASSVRLQYDGHPVDLAPQIRAEVARLTVQ